MRSACAACKFKTKDSAGATKALRQIQAKKPPLSGIFNVDKPAGMTSHDVVREIRKASGERRVGHAGTLDPLATGVLLVCVGKATRVTEYLMEHPKSYRAEITLGISTDTLDAEGEVTHVADSVDVSREDVEAALQTFLGEIQQIPPMYSAVKKGGKKLYELAREGITVERDPRDVEITRLGVVEWDRPRLTVEMDCSKGTYVRAVARDLGELLGTGAHLSHLVRTASGRFTVDEANNLQTVVDALREDWWMLLMHPLDEALLSYEAMIVDEETATRIQQGQMIEAPEPIHTPYARAYSDDGRFIALMRYEQWADQWQPNKVFATTN